MTPPQIYNPPSALKVALAQVDAWLQAPKVMLLAEASGYWPELRAVLAAGLVAGPQVHDARLAATAGFMEYRNYGC